MAQRVFLVQLPVDDLALVIRAILGPENDRRDVARTLAESSAGHILRATVSERIAHAVEADVGYEGTPEDWGFIRNCLPYVVAATRSEEITDKLREFEKLDDEDEISEFLWGEVRAMGMSTCPADSSMQAPDVPTVADWINDQLGRVRDLREQAKTHGDDETWGDYAVSTWIWLARIFARLRPCFWQGRNRWIGNAAFPFEEDIGVTPPTGNFGFGQSVSLEALLAANRRANSAARAQKANATLQGLIDSTANLVPEFELTDWLEDLPPGGSGSLASGYVDAANVAALRDEMARVRAEQDHTYDPEWTELVHAAAELALRLNAHIVEGDDAIYGAYRWPILE